jgi:hypothetical protein
METDTSPGISFEAMLIGYQDMKAPTRIVVTIDLGATPADPSSWVLTTDSGDDARSVYLMPGDEVQWRLKGSSSVKGFRVDFNSGTPFESSTSVQVVGPVSPVCTIFRLPKPHPHPFDKAFRYKYSITVDNFPPLDPDVVVGGPGNKGR